MAVQYVALMFMVYHLVLIVCIIKIRNFKLTNNFLILIGLGISCVHTELHQFYEETR